jgi:hypothetical protein
LDYELLLEGVPDSRSLVTRDGRYVMEQFLCEPVELTESELDAVTGGNPFSQNGTAVALAQNYENFGQIGVDLTAVASVITIG